MKRNPIKIENLREMDWRGLIAIVVLLGGFVLLGLAITLDREIEGVVGIMMILVVEWYFKSKQDDKEKCPHAK